MRAAPHIATLAQQVAILGSLLLLLAARDRGQLAWPGHSSSAQQQTSVADNLASRSRSIGDRCRIADVLLATADSTAGTGAQHDSSSSGHVCPATAAPLGMGW